MALEISVLTGRFSTDDCKEKADGFYFEYFLYRLNLSEAYLNLSGFNVRSKTVPTPGSDLTVKSPPNYKAILLLMLSPSP